MIKFLKIFLIKLIFFLNIKKKNHTLSDKIIISFTSYHKRFKYLDLTIESLLNQSLKFYKLILWLSKKDYQRLYRKITKYEKYGLCIKICNDLKSYDKIIHSLNNYSNYFIVTADDDIIYRRNWLYELVNSWSGNSQEIVCHRAHKILLDDNGYIKPYLDWDLNIESKESSIYIFPTTGGGVLYPPKCFHPNVSREEEFLRLCPSADDIWLYWMARLNNSYFTVTNYSKKLIHSPNNNTDSLMSYNWEKFDLDEIKISNNDIQIINLNKFYPLFKINPIILDNLDRLKNEDL